MFSFSGPHKKETSMCNKRDDSHQEHTPAMLSRREALKAGAAAAILPLFGGVNSIAQASQRLLSTCTLGR